MDDYYYCYFFLSETSGMPDSSTDEIMIKFSSVEANQSRYVTVCMREMQGN